jgi:ribose transport system substrate-binding protein
MEKAFGLFGAAILAAFVAGTAPSLAEDKVLALVVKGVDDPFFDLMHQGCEKWNKENTGSGYKCFYTGPAMTSDEAAQVPMLEDLMTKGVAAMAISPTNGPTVANLIKRQKPTIPIITVDADLLAADHALRRTFVGSDSYQMGEKFAEALKKLKPNGGKICLQLATAATDNINRRAAGTRDGLAGNKGTDRLAGQNGWTEVEGCPVYSNGDIALANKQLADVLLANPDLDAFVPMGGWAQFGQQAYAQSIDQFKDRLDSGKLVVVSGDTGDTNLDALKNGRSTVNIGQRPFELGYRAAVVMLDLINGKTVEDPVNVDFDVCTKATLETCLAR